MFLINRSFWEIKKTKTRGRGVFAKKEIKKGTIVGDYTGKLITLGKIDFDKEKKNLYLMNYKNKIGVYPDLRKNGVHLLNHSCSPNCFIYRYKDRTLVFTLRHIKSGEELTIHYLLPPRKYCDPCPHRCLCQSKYCTGTMHLSEEKYKSWQKFLKQNFKVGFLSKQPLGKVLKKLPSYPKHISKNYINGVRVFLRK